MNYEGIIIRPPSEADSIILQVTVGCSHNKCTFCGTYKGVRFRIKALEVIKEDLAFAARYCQRQRRVFLADGDALIMPQVRLVALFRAIREVLPRVQRISLYGNAKAIKAKSLADLQELKGLGLDRVYMGLESGHDPTLTAIRKGVDSRTMIAAGRKVREGGLFLSVTVLLGIAGAEDSLVHAAHTGEVLTAMAPHQIAALTLMVLEGTPLHELERNSAFRLPSQEGLLLELKTLIEHINLERAQFHSNHASNYLALNGRLARDREALLASIGEAMAGKRPLVPEHMRRL